MNLTKFFNSLKFVFWHVLVASFFSQSHNSIKILNKICTADYSEAAVSGKNGQ